MEPQRKQVIIALVILAVLLVLAGVVTYELRSPNGLYARQHADLKSAEAANESPYTDLSGKAVRLSAFQGKPLIVNVWASWSPFSKDELPMLSRAQQHYGAAITVVAMNRKEDSARAQAYLTFIGNPQGLIYLVDPTDHFYNTVSGYAMPETIIYDGVGNIMFHKRGVLTELELSQNIEAVLSKK